MIIRAILEWDEEAKSYSSTCPELNHVSSCGDTETEAIETLKEAIQLFLEPIPNHFINLNSQTDAIEILI